MLLQLAWTAVVVRVLDAWEEGTVMLLRLAWTAVVVGVLDAREERTMMGLMEER